MIGSKETVLMGPSIVYAYQIAFGSVSTFISKRGPLAIVSETVGSEKTQ